MPVTASSHITIRVTPQEKDRINLLSNLEDKPVSKLFKEFVEKELQSKKLKASDIRKLPKDLRSKLLKKMTEDSLPHYLKYKDELFIDETGDGIE